MNGEIGDPKDLDNVEDDIESDEFSDDTVVLEDIADDELTDLSVEADVNRLVTKLDSSDPDDVQRQREVHRRLEEIQDQKEAEENIDSTFNFNLDDDL